jgi:hypothetical protein
MVKLITVCMSEDKDIEKEAVVGRVRAGDDIRIENNGQ